MKLQVRCKLNEFDDYINKYFSHPVDLWALDPESVTGQWVQIFGFFFNFC